MFVTINDSQYNVLEFTAYRVLNTKEHPIGVEVHFVGGMKLIKDFDTEAEREEFISKLGSTYVELSNIFYNAMYFTAYYTEDVVLDSTSYNVVAHYNGPTKLVFKFETEAARNEFVEKLDAMSLGGMTQKDTFADFPQTGSPSGIYLAKDTGQMYFWDEVLKTYEKLGVSRKGGVYSYNNVINNTIGHISKINKADLVELVKPSVAFMDGSEVIGNNSVRGVITASDAETVTVRTITDLVIDSFVQVDTGAALPEHGADNVLYYIKDEDEVKCWDKNSGYKYMNKGVYIDNNNLTDPKMLQKLSTEYRKFLNKQPYQVYIYGEASNDSWPGQFLYQLYFKVPNGGPGSYGYMYSPFFVASGDGRNSGQGAGCWSIYFNCSGSTITKLSQSKFQGYMIAAGEGSLLRTHTTSSYDTITDYDPASKKYVDKQIAAESSIVHKVDKLPEDIIVQRPVSPSGNVGSVYTDTMEVFLSENATFDKNYASILSIINDPEKRSQYGEYYAFVGDVSSNIKDNNFLLGFITDYPEQIRLDTDSQGFFRCFYDANKPVYGIYFTKGKEPEIKLITANTYSHRYTSCPIGGGTGYRLRANMTLTPYSTRALNSYWFTVAKNSTLGNRGAKVNITHTTPIYSYLDGKLYPVSMGPTVRNYREGTIFAVNDELYQSRFPDTLAGTPVEYFPLVTNLGKTNNQEYTPTEDYHPATKKYVDDQHKHIFLSISDVTTPDKIVTAIGGQEKLIEIWNWIEAGNEFTLYVKDGCNVIPYTTRGLGQYVPNTVFLCCTVNSITATTTSVGEKYVPIYVLTKVSDTQINVGIGSKAKVENLAQESYVDSEVNKVKQYVDNKTNSLYFEGNSNEWAALTETEKANYLVSIVEPIAETDDDIEALLQSIIKDVEPTETSDDITEDEAVVILDNIIEGGE